MSDQLHWRDMDTKLVAVDNVHVIKRIITPSKTRIDAMAKALAGRGQLQPIVVTKHLHSAWRVVAGATRLRAAEQLGWKHIKATIISADNDIEYQLIEIDENLHRHDLSSAERKRLKAKDKELRAERLKQLKQEIEEAKAEPKAKGGRGKKGGVADKARKAGVPLATAQRQLAKPTQNEKRVGLEPPETNPPEPSEPDGGEVQLVRCPLCHGKGEVAAPEAEAVRKAIISRIERA